eukprot:TRINITY_DN69439_c0_g1_i1.p1 TRINITY_DN69439_c0_g1~~TRINITY_DN69439_c0_g1_i1.p1  ORF type:complete len:366 (+),score=27.55 TRINITY_DN69439_c0_g1_i1:140-1099(+)
MQDNAACVQASPTAAVPEPEPFCLASPGSGIPPPPQLGCGLAFIKVDKVGGSTWGGVMRRIGYRHGLHHTKDGPRWIDLEEEPQASVWANHGTRRQMNKRVSELMPNAIWVTLLREPVARVMSEFYHFEVSRKNVKPTIQAKVAHLQKTSSDFQFSYISKEHHHTPEDVFSSYNFIGVTERFDESLVLLGKYLNISMLDMLYLKSKDSSKVGTDLVERGRRMYKHPPIDKEPDVVQRAAAFLKDRRLLDVRLLELANERLDKAVNEYGPNFNADLRSFVARLALVEEVCRPHFEEACLWNDNACGQDCIDSLAKAAGWS